MIQTVFDQSCAWLKSHPTANQSGSYPSRVVVGTMPSGDGTIFTGNTNPDAILGPIPSTLQFLFYGAGADDATLSVRILGWKPLGNGTWVPQCICTANLTLGNITGNTGLSLGTADRLVDIVSVTNGIGTVYSPASDTQAAILEVPTAGCPVVTVDFNMGTATGGNSLYSRF